MKKVCSIFLPVLIFIFLVNTNTASATQINYSFSVEVGAVTCPGDPLNFDGGRIDLAFGIDNGSIPDQIINVSGYAQNALYDNIVANLKLTRANNDIIYDASTVGEFYVTDTDNATGPSNVVDSVWWGTDISISGIPVIIDLSAWFNNDFINNTSPFAFSTSDPILIAADIFDPNPAPGSSSLLYYNWQVHSAVASGTPVPEPTTMLLVGSGLIGLAGIRKKYKTIR